PYLCRIGLPTAYTADGSIGLTPVAGSLVLKASIAVQWRLVSHWRDDVGARWIGLVCLGVTVPRQNG
ncbi:hypothetical protein, partial [Halopseudomonas pelagia]|uniref:hypothetical protein n=1 Tax=Halopseudomonas pelagia TaxID=553151 RepID=UPI001C547242